MSANNNQENGTGKLSMKERMKLKMNASAAVFESKKTSTPQLNNIINLLPNPNLITSQQFPNQFSNVNPSYTSVPTTATTIQPVIQPKFDVATVNPEAPKMKKTLKLKTQDQAFVPTVSKKQEDKPIEKLETKEEKEDKAEKKMQLSKKVLKLPTNDQCIFEAKKEESGEKKEGEKIKEVEVKEGKKEEEMTITKDEEREGKVVVKKITTQFLLDLLDQEPQVLDDNNDFHRVILEVQSREEFFEFIKQKKQNNNNNNNKQNQYQMKGIQKGTHFKKNQSQPGGNSYQQSDSNGKPYVSNYHLKRAPPDEFKMALQEKAGAWTKKNQEVQDEKLVYLKKIKATLNKITPETYDKLYVTLLKLGGESLECTQELADLIIKNSWEHKNYGKLYATMCKQLSEEESLAFGSKDKSLNMFRKEMMSKIQKTFEGEIKVFTGKQDKKEEELSPEEKAEFAQTIKRRTMNNFRFIGELYNSKFLNRVIIYDCFFSQLYIFNQQYYQQEVEGVDNKWQQQLEGLLLILEIIGKKLEHELDNKTLVSKDRHQDQKVVKHMYNVLEHFYTTSDKNTYAALQAEEKTHYQNKKFLDIEQIFDVLFIIKKHANLNKRLDSLIANLIQKKQENWEERFLQGEGPKKLSQIHNEHTKQQDIIDEKVESNYQKKSKNYNDSFHQRRYDDHKQSNYEEVLYVARDEEPQKRKRKQTYEGLTAHEVDEKFKEMNKKLDSGRVDPTDSSSKEYTQVDYLKEGQQLNQESDNIVFLELYFKYFSDGRKDNVHKRLGLIFHLFQEKFILLSEIIKEVSTNYHKMWEVADDYPEMANAFSIIIYQFIENSSFTLSSLNFKLTVEDEDLKEMQQYFFQTILEKVILKFKAAATAQDNIPEFIALLTQMETQDPNHWLKTIPKLNI